MATPSISPFARVLGLSPNSIATAEGTFTNIGAPVDITAGPQAIAQPSALQVLAIDKQAAGSATVEIQLPPGNWAVVDAQFTGGGIAGAGDVVTLATSTIGGLAPTPIATFDLNALTSVVGTVSRLTAFTAGSSISVRGPVWDASTSAWVPLTGDECFAVDFTEVVDANGTLILYIAQG